MELDLRGLRCPLPALRTEKALRVMRAGDRLTVLADDPLATLDIANLCREGGHALVETAATESGCRFVVAKGPDSTRPE